MKKLVRIAAVAAVVLLGSFAPTDPAAAGTPVVGCTSKVFYQYVYEGTVKVGWVTHRTAWCVKKATSTTWTRYNRTSSISITKSSTAPAGTLAFSPTPSTWTTTSSYVVAPTTVSWTNRTRAKPTARKGKTTTNCVHVQNFDLTMTNIDCPTKITV